MTRKYTSGAMTRPGRRGSIPSMKAALTYLLFPPRRGAVSPQLRSRSFLAASPQAARVTPGRILP